MMELNECINFLLTAVQNAVHTRFKTSLQPFDVTPAQYMVMYFLCREGNLSPSVLAQFCRLDTSTMTGILTRMEKKGLIERRHSENDRRSVDICITSEGAAILPDILTAINNCNAETLVSLLPEEQRLLRSYLSRIMDSLE